jgi:hypothetical protein
MILLKVDMSRKLKSLEISKIFENFPLGLLDIRPRTIAMTIVGGAAVYAAYVYIQKRLDNIPPKKFVQ